jgi:hypothetical protein
VNSSLRLIVATGLWTCGLVATLLSATALPLWLRLLASAGALVLIVPAALRTLALRGTSAVRRVVWEADGGFTLTLADGVVERGCLLTHASAAAGPWLWLGLRGRRLHRVVLDRRCQDPAAFAALRRRLHLQRHGA